MEWYQKTFTLPPYSRGCHLITHLILREIPEVEKLRIGLLHVFIHHTSASLTLNENADSDVRRDLARLLDHLAPEQFPYAHTLEGMDDMPAHAKSSLMGASLTIPISDRKVSLGTWQGIYLCEHRNHGGVRTITVTASGVGYS